MTRQACLAILKNLIILSEAKAPLELVARDEQSGEECHCGGEGCQGGRRGRRVPHSGGHYPWT